MSAGLKGDYRKTRELEKRISDLPRMLGIEVARSCADIISRLARASFDASCNAFYDPWDPSAKGETVTLVKSGALRSGIRYVAIGTRLRAQLGPKYAKYQVGKRAVFPTSVLPPAYKKAIDEAAAKIIAAQLGKAA